MTATGVAETSSARLLKGIFGLAVLFGMTALAGGESASPQNDAQDIRYDNYRKTGLPLSIHVVRVPRKNNRFQLGTMHATGKALGLTSVTDQTKHLNPSARIPVAAINGDFYQREGPYAGDPRGLQILDGELISAPTGGASFWIDALGQPHTTNTVSRLQVTWPDGRATAIGLNERWQPNRTTLYTPALGSSTRTTSGRELVLERQGTNAWLPVRPGRTYRVQVREVRESGDTPILPETMVLSIGPAAIKGTPHVEAGANLSISTVTEPSLRGVRTAISGGPVLVRNAKPQRFKDSDSDAYAFSSMMERHPRSALGWNADYYFLVTVDGRQKDISVGMTLNELASYMAELGCQEVMNLDGGGSATLWYNGQVRNRPCDGYEREVANSLIVWKTAGTGEPKGVLQGDTEK